MRRTLPALAVAGAAGGLLAACAPDSVYSPPHTPATVMVAPTTTYVAPAPAYVTAVPTTTYVAPAPTYVAPTTTYVAPTYVPAYVAPATIVATVPHYPGNSPTTENPDARGGADR